MSRDGLVRLYCMKGRYQLRKVDTNMSGSATLRGLDGAAPLALLAGGDDVGV